MKFGSRHDFHVVDGIGDLIIHFWRTRQSFTMQDAVRRTLKFAVLVLVILAMIHVLYPTQKRGWLLWLGPHEEDLASWTAVVLVGFSAMILTLVRESWQHGHRILASFAGCFMAVLMIVVLGGAWNYYAATSSRAVASSEAATTGVADRIGDATRALAALDASQSRSLAAIDAAIANAPANRLNGRAALLRQRTTTETGGRTERARLETELKAARAENVTTQTVEFDPRPIDKFMAEAFHTDRQFMGSLNDLIRSINFEFIAILGVALGTAVALSRAGAPIQAEPIREGLRIEDHSREADLAEQPYDRAVATAEFEDIEDGFHFVRGGKRKNPRRRSKPAFDENGVEAAATSSKLTDTGARPHPWTVPTNMAFEAGGPQEREDDEKRTADDDRNASTASDGAGAEDAAGAIRAGDDPSPVDGDRSNETQDGAAELQLRLTDPAPLPAAEFDRLVAIGAIAEDGTPLSQEDSPVIEQEDRSPKRPMLAAPVHEYEAAK